MADAVERHHVPSGRTCGDLFRSRAVYLRLLVPSVRFELTLYGF